MALTICLSALGGIIASGTAIFIMLRFKASNAFIKRIIRKIDKYPKADCDELTAAYIEIAKY